ncbi:DNA-binding NarL/FixJ family response regulator [Propionicimonas paludicola]|uniref:DNA-binding NarL/FixJ family response regulator n=1 Tax=Propionicimonas paludicola TaxID=185243 RepID=A0A2A9CUE8_9ACTN|nr:response regulator transcription factor [Propionicimonas paludicola]PFG17250.1 DNA-binding NarL/FixJ family response regulator [Propionicimonas paludicola]
MTTVIIVDDDLFVRTMLAQVLDRAAGIQVLATYANGAEAAEAAAELVPDVALVDINMPEVGGAQTVALLQASSPTTRVLALTSLADPSAAAAMLHAGALGFLPKDLPLPALLHSIQAASHGVAVLAGGGSALIDKRVGAKAPELTEIEHKVLQLLAAGHTNEQIADQLYLAVSSVKHQISTLLVKLEASNRVTLAVRAHELGLAGPGRSE